MLSASIPPSIDDLKAKLPPFCRLHGITRLEVFGSVGRGEMHPGSDVDLLVTFRPGLELGLEFFAIQDELEHLLGCDVDLLTRRSVERDQNAIRKQSILASAREIYAG